jgi:hypothetical protein
MDTLLALPLYVYPFILAVVSALAGRFLVGRVRDDPGSLPGWILYAVALGSTLIGLIAFWMDYNY